MRQGPGARPRPLPPIQSSVWAVSAEAAWMNGLVEHTSRGIATALRTRGECGREVPGAVLGPPWGLRVC